MNEKKAKKIKLLRIFSTLWKKKIRIAAVSVAFAVIAVISAVLFVPTKYQANILIYIDNASITVNNNNNSVIYSSNQLATARALLDSYVVALNSRTCLDSVIEKADLTYTRTQLKNMISASSVNETEWFSVSVTSTVPGEAKTIANTVADVFPDMLKKIITGSSVEVVDYANENESVVSTGYVSYAALGFLAGLLLSVLYIVIKDALNDKIHDEETLTDLSADIPVLATVPHNTVKGKGNKFTAVCDDLDFATAEAYKLLQTSVEYSFESGSCKVIGVTSSERNEGKSTLAVNLAYMLSCDKKKVLLLDGDMRLPSIAKKLGIESTPGLSDYLTGKAKNNEGIKHSEKAPNLSVICAGVVPPNPFGLLGSQSMERLLTALKDVFDYVIIDLPPVNIVSDPLAIAKYVDGFIITVRSEYTTQKGVRDVMEKLNLVNSNIMGFVVNSNEQNYKKKYGNYGYHNDYENGYSAKNKSDSDIL